MTALVVEGPLDAALLRPLLSAADLDEVSIKVAGGRSSALSLGQSIASARGVPVAVLVDGDTTDQRSLEQQRLIFFDLQRTLAPSAPCALFLAMPTLEEDLFPDADTFASIYGIKLGSRDREVFAADRRAFLKRRLRLTRARQAEADWHGEVDPAGAGEGWGRPLLDDLLSYLRPDVSFGLDP